MNPNNLTRRHAITGVAATIAAIATSSIAANLASSASEKPVDRQQSKNPVVLITGSSSGFGRLMALTFARNGYQVYASMRNLQTRNAKAAAELQEIADREKLVLAAVEIDVDSDESVNRGVNLVMDRAGKIDIAINNAGIVVPSPQELQSVEYASRAFQTNVFGALRINRAVLPQMRDRKNGLIVQISSGLGRMLTLPGIGTYCGTKAALESMIEALSYELHPFGVDVAIVQPGEYPTRFKANGLRQLQEYQNSLAKSDRDRANSYKEHLQRLQADFQRESQENSQVVADEVLKLAQMAARSRPLRTVVSPFARPLEALNKQQGDLQQMVLSRTAYKDWV